MNKVDMAKIAYVSQNAYRSIIDPSTLLQTWEEATKEERDSYIAGVEWVMNNPTTTAEYQHNAWMKHKRDSGWVYGVEKDGKLRVHPLLVPWHKTSLEHRTKYALFIAVVKSLLPMQNYLRGKT